MLITVSSAIVLLAAHMFHLGTALLAARRAFRTTENPLSLSNGPLVTIVQPVGHVDELTERTLASVFRLNYSRYDVVFCTPGENDPAVPLIRRLMDQNPRVSARLLSGRQRFTRNPKLDNMEKGWPACGDREWVIVADSNVQMPPDLIQRLFAAWREDTGLTCSPPMGSDPRSFWSDVECAFLNTYQARLQLAADTLGLGFAHGKAMLFRRSLLNQEGFDALAFETAEDSAATKLVRSKGLRVRLVDHLFEQPLGQRSFADVWHRQLRWALLRHQSFPRVFALEVLTTSLVPLAAALTLAANEGGAQSLAGVISMSVWLGVEYWLAACLGWPVRRGFVPACVCRDILITTIWSVAWFRSRYRWRGNPVDLSAI